MNSLLKILEKLISVRTQASMLVDMGILEEGIRNTMFLEISNMVLALGAMGQNKGAPILLDTLFHAEKYLNMLAFKCHGMCEICQEEDRKKFHESFNRLFKEHAKKKESMEKKVGEAMIFPQSTPRFMQ